MPLGVTNAAGSFLQTYPIGAWKPGYGGFVIYTQLFAPVGNTAYLSYGRRTATPTTTPGPLIKRLWATSASATTGTLQDLGAVFRLDY